MEIGEQIFDLFVREHVAEAVHLVASDANDVPDANVIRRQAALAEKWSLENAFEAGPLAPAGGVCRVTAVAVLVVDVMAGGLLRIQSQLGVTLPALDITPAQRNQQK